MGEQSGWAESGFDLFEKLWLSCSWSHSYQDADYSSSKVHLPVGSRSKIIDDLETLAITQPCTTTAKEILFLDGGTAAYGVLEVVVGSAVSESESTAIGAALAVLFLASAVFGAKKVNESRAFNARLMLERRRGGASSLASHEWLNQPFPVPDLGANALDPVFSGSISNTPKH